MTEDRFGDLGPGDRPDSRRTGGGAPTSGEAGVDEPALPNLLVRLVHVFIAPGALFERLRERPAWLDALLLGVGLALAATLLVPVDVMVEAMQAGLPPDADPEAAENIADFAESSLFQALRIGAALLIPPIVALVVAGFLGFVYDLILGGTAGFTRLFSVAVHGLLITQLGGLAVVPLLVATGDPNNLLALHLLVPGMDRETFLFRFLSGLNVFSLWTATVLGIGVGKLYPKRSGRAAAGLLVGLYVTIRVVAALVQG